MLGTRICLIPISHDKRVPDYNECVQCGINPFLFLDINVPTIVQKKFLILFRLHHITAP